MRKVVVVMQMRNIRSGLENRLAVAPCIRAERGARGFSRWAVLASLLTLGLLGRSAHAAGLERLSSQCLPEEAYTAIETCPAGPTKFEVNSRHSTAFKSAPPPREKKSQKDTLEKKQAPDEMSAGQRDLRTTRLQQYR